MHISILREMPARLEEIVKAGNTEVFRNLLLNAAGFQAHYAVTINENPREGYRISVWDSAGAGQAFSPARNTPS